MAVECESQYKTSLRKIHLKMSSAEWWPFCSGTMVLFMTLPVMQSIASSRLPSLNNALSTTNQCWLIKCVLWHSSEGIFTINSEVICPGYEFDNHQLLNFIIASVMSHWAKMLSVDFQFDLVCDRKWMSALASSMYFFGFMAVFPFGIASDRFVLQWHSSYDNHGVSNHRQLEPLFHSLCTQTATKTPKAPH